jgi:predicted aspartyl protease
VFAPATTVPFALVDNRMVIQATIDGRGPYALIVDTGSYDLVITPAVAAQLKLPTTSAGSATGAGSGSEQVSSAHLATLAIGAMRFNNQPCEVLDLSRIAHAFGFSHLDGIVGYALLRRLRVGVDMDASRLTLSAAPIAAPVRATATPFRVNGDDIITLDGAVDGLPAKFMVDTGDRTSLTLIRHFARAHDFYSRAAMHDVITGVGIGGPIYSDVLRTRVSVFGSTIPNVVTRASRDKGGAFANAAEDASVGMGLLKRFNIVYDYPRNRLYAWPSHYYRVPDTFRPPLNAATSPPSSSRS